MARICGPCTACCKTHSVLIEGVEKPRGEWCAHCKPGKGCSIYENRPLDCRTFTCEWLKGIGKEEDRPDLRKIVFNHIKKYGPRMGYVQFWEVSEGALESKYAKDTARNTLKVGLPVVFIYLRSEAKVFIPDPFPPEDRKILLNLISRGEHLLGKIEELR